MLLNNLDAEVAEHPEELVVYGGSGQGRAQPTRRCGRSSARCSRSATTRRCSSRAASRSASSGRIRGAPRVLIANSLLVPRWATWDEFRRLEARGSDDVRPDDGRELDLHRHAGDPPGHVPDVRRGGREALRLARPRAAGRSSPRGSAGWAARSRSPRRWPARRSSASRSTRRGSSGALETRYLDEAADSLDDALARVRAAAAERPRRSRSGCSGTRRTSFRSSRARGEHFDLVTDQTAAHDPLTGYVPAGLPCEEAARAARARPGRVPPARARVDRRARRRACSSSSDAAAMFSIMATTCEGRPVRPA